MFLFPIIPNSAQPLIEKFSLSVEKGERIAIIGKNGRGKSTFCVYWQESLLPTKGPSKALKTSPSDISVRPISIDCILNTPLKRRSPLQIQNLTYTQIKGICGLMMFSGDKSTKLNSVLSGGEKSRVLLGKIIATPCNFLLLDEPTHHLDMESIEALIDAIEDFQGAVIMVIAQRINLKAHGFR